MLGVTLFLNDLSQRTEQVFALIGDTAADAEYVGLEDVEAQKLSLHQATIGFRRPEVLMILWTVATLPQNLSR